MEKTSGLSPQDRMVQEQLIERGIRDGRVLAAMRAIPRDQFFPAEIREHAHADRAAPIGHGQTISQPYIVALMTERLDAKPEHRILEIGTGSGYHTAILAKLVGEVYTVERIKPLLDEAFERLMGLGIRNVHFRFGDGTLGWREFAPYDRIIVAAGAPDLPTELLLTQLKDHGIAVLPVGPQDQQMLVEVRRNGNELVSQDICPCRFVKLIGQRGWASE